MTERVVTIVLGSQFGDEGKGKLVDILTETADVCARCQGGNNAGHTIVASGVKYACHLLPSGIVNPNTENLIGSGVVVHIPSLFSELEAIHEKGLHTTGRIFISSRAHIVLNLHQLVDKLEEIALGDQSVGTTRKGIGPAYSSKAGRNGLRIGELRLDNWVLFKTRFHQLVQSYRHRFGELLDEYDEDSELAQLEAFTPRLEKLVVDAVPWMHERMQANKRILVEGANALMLDIDYGTYPFVTSSNACLGGVFTGLAISPFRIKEVVGVTKAYLTRVGSGPFPTEQLNEIGDHLQTVGREFGVTTGRKRRCGWLDLVMLNHSARINHYTSLNLTKLDVLDGLSTIKVAIAYRLPDNSELTSFPADLRVLSNVEPIYRSFPGWSQEIKGLASYDQLPQQAKNYVEFIENFSGIKIQSIGCGPARDDMILR